MTNRVSILWSSCFVLSLGVFGCDDSESVGVHEVMMRTEPGGEPEFAGGGCVVVEGPGGPSGGGAGMGPEIADEVSSENGKVVYRYYIAKEGTSPEHVTPTDGELAAEIDADMEFFASGEVKHVSFGTYAGVLYDVYLWGEPDCEGDIYMEPPESD